MEARPVVVVGAGPTGLTRACGLRACGVPVRVLDAAGGPATTSRALGLQPRGVEVLDRLDALGDLPAHALAVREIVVHVDGRELGRLAVGATTPLVRRPGLLVSQAEIERRLRDRLHELGGAVEWTHGVTGLAPGDEGIAVRTSSEAVVDGAWVVGCDGAHSQVRRAAGIGFPGVPLAERFLLADVRADLPFARHAVAVWLHGADLVAAIPLPGADRWRIMAPAADPAGDPAPAAVLAELSGALVRLAGLPDATAREALWTSAFRFHRRLADTYRSGRVLLAGDAAHIHSPFGGQGLNTGIGDAENLAWKLALVHNGRAAPDLLDTYEAERRPVAVDVLAGTSGLTRVVLGDGAVTRLLRDRVLVPLMNRPLVQRIIWEQASQLRVSYRHGPLGGPGRARPRPGDRVPDHTCRTTDGTPTSLHATLRGPGRGWAVLAPDPAAADAHADAAAHRLGDAAVARLVADTGRDTLLVRPDAHLAWRGRSPDGLDAALAAFVSVRSRAAAG